MFLNLIVLLAASALPSLVSGHGIITSPAIRTPGPALITACGRPVYDNINGDQYGPQQLVEQNLRGANPAVCRPWLCKGLQFADNAGVRVQHYTVGQVVPIRIDNRARHTGIANVSVVATSTNSVIGSPLISWTNAYPNEGEIPANQLNFSVTIPSLGSRCSTAGNCVLQWWWDARSVDQTYMSCVDFTQ